MTIGKEYIKGMLGGRDHEKYAMHGPNDVIRAAQLRDGRSVVEFLRSNPYWGGPGNAATAYELPRVLTKRMLDRLVKREGFCVFYTHLGKIKDAAVPFDSQTCDALRCLAGFQREGRILVTTTRRLLGYARAAQTISVSGVEDDTGFRIEISTPGESGPAVSGLADGDLNGLTFYVPDPHRTRIAINGRDVSDIRRNDADGTGHRSVSLPWHAPLEFPDV